MGSERHNELLNSLQQLHHILREKIKSRWNRVIPLAESVTDRWEKAKYLGFGKGSSIYDNSYVFGEVSVGENTWIGPFTILDGSGGLKIGSFCSISAGVQIYTHDSIDWALSGGKEAYAYASVEIGNNCYIGPNTVITRGVTIGDRTIIGANSLVLENIPAGSRAMGTPARVVAPSHVSRE